MKKTAAVFLLFVLAAVCGAAGLRGTWKKHQYKVITDTFAGIILPMAEDAELYYGALDAAEKCVMGQKTPEDTVKELEQTREKLTVIRDGLTGFETDREAAGFLKEAGLDREGTDPGNGRRAGALDEYIWSIESLGSYFQDQHTYDNSEKMEWRRTLTAIRDAPRGLRFYGDINSRFAGWKETQISYVMERIVDRLPADITEKFAWETDPLVIEKKLELCRENLEQYYEIKYPVASPGKLEEIRREYEREAGLKKQAPVYPADSWMNSLVTIRQRAEEMAYFNEAVERRDEYGDLYFDMVLEQ